MKQLLILLAIFTLSVAVLDRKRVILVDTAGQNLLYRSNSPVDTATKTYDLDLLISYMQDVATQNGITFPTNYTVVAYSLLNVFEPGHREPEIKYFKQHPQYTLIQKVILGNFISPNKYPKFVIKQMAKDYLNWDLDELGNTSTLIHDTLLDQGDLPKIIFFHCVAGEDRTGEVFAAYKMLFNNWSYVQALDFDNQVESRDIKVMSRNGIIWFCYYLLYAEGVQNNCQYQG